MIPHVKDIDDSLFCGISCAICFAETKKVEKCCDKELETVLPQWLFSSLNLNKKNLILDLDYQNFERQCYFLQIYELRKKFRYLIHYTSEKLVLQETF